MKNKYRITEDHTVFALEDDRKIDITENDILEDVSQAHDNNNIILIFQFNNIPCWQYPYSLEDKIEIMQ